MNKFKAGDTVELINGSPTMAVDSINEEGTRATCVWFVGSTNKRATFALVVLKKVDMEESKLEMELVIPDGTTNNKKPPGNHSG